MALVLSHHESRCIRYQHSYMIVERRTWGEHAEVAILTKFSSPTAQVPPKGWGGFYFAWSFSSAYQYGLWGVLSNGIVLPMTTPL